MRRWLWATPLLLAAAAHADNGSRLWLRGERNGRPARVAVEAADTGNATLRVARAELRDGWRGRERVALRVRAGAPDGDGYYIKRSRGRVEIGSASPLGALYGSYALLRLQATGGADTLRAAASRPARALRILNHWDNPDGRVERGYAGRSIFWGGGGADLEQYARACASVGINAAVLNNVNAKPEMLGRARLLEAAAIAGRLRPYGVRVFLSVNFASPKALGGLATADPLDGSVRAWWRRKADEIYALIPDFGGFLVKANSEGEPGPMDYGRTHADGANMLAEALAPHGGTVMWRAFVYAPASPDRAAQAYDEFMPLDGRFAPNVIVQVKNGPVDFQPREPVSPLLLSMERTRTMMEVQVTQEYLGENIHSVFLAPMWKEAEDVCRAYGPRRADGGARAVAGVANIGDDANWCGSDMAQANWYAFGRLAWDPSLDSRAIAEEWLRQTFAADTAFVRPMAELMVRSHEAAVKYMMPLGLHHIFAGDHHYGPEPWCAREGWRADWLPRYYHRADTAGVGFDRTVETGSRAIGQYPDALQARYGADERLLLWFRHVAWTHRMRDGRTLWEALCRTYDEGVAEAGRFAATWRAMRPYVDEERWTRQMRRFDRQAKDAWWWRDACLLYFQTFSRLPLPDGSPAPRHRLADLMRFRLDMDIYSAADPDALP